MRLTTHESRPARYPGDAWQQDERLNTIAGGAVSSAPPPTPEPSNASRIGQGGACPQPIGTLERTTGAAWHRPPVRSGERQVTTGATGGTTTKRKTDGEEARGGERYARAGKATGDMELRWGNLGGGGERGGTTAISGPE